MIPVGWVLQFRVHGVTLEKPRLVFTGPARAGGPTTEVEVASEKPSILGQFARMPKVVLSGQPFGPYAIAGLKAVTKPEEDGYLAPYVWLTITVREETKLPGGLEARFRADPGGVGPEAEKVVTGVLEKLRVEAGLVAGACAAQLPDAVFEQWSAMRLLWHAPNTSYVSYNSDPVEVLEPRELPPAPINLAITQAAGVVRRVPKEVRPVLLAAQWLISARLARPTTPERFLGMFRVLETLCGLAEDVPLRHAADFDKMLALVNEHGPELAPLVKSAKAVYRNPPLADRFDALSRKFSPESAARDAEVFVELANMRNDFVHGRTLGVPERMSDARMTDKVLHEMAHRYVRIVIERESAVDK